MKRCLFLVLCLYSQIYAYQVSFEGNVPEEIILTATSISQLESQKERPPPTLFTLKREQSLIKNLLFKSYMPLVTMTAKSISSILALFQIQRSASFLSRALFTVLETL